MDVMIMATNGCSHCKNMEKELKFLSIPYWVCFAEDRADHVIAFAVVVVLLFLSGGGTMIGVTLSGGMMGNGAMGGINWMWIQTSLMLGLGVLLIWVIFGQKK